MTTDDPREAARASESLPEEASTSAQSRAALAHMVLADSDARQGDRDAAPASTVEHRRSEETVDRTGDLRRDP